LADSVSKWWNTNQSNWTRFKTIKEGLLSSEAKLQGKMLQYLLYGKAACQELTLESYQKDLKPLVQKIQRSKNSQARLAKSLLEENDFSWLKIKPQKTGS